MWNFKRQIYKTCNAHECDARHLINITFSYEGEEVGGTADVTFTYFRVGELTETVISDMVLANIGETLEATFDVNDCIDETRLYTFVVTGASVSARTDNWNDAISCC